MADDVIDNTVNSFTALIIGVILFCAVGIPIVSMMVDYILQKDSNGDFLFGGDVEMYSLLITVTMIMVLVGLIIGIIRKFSVKSR